MFAKVRHRVFHLRAVLWAWFYYGFWLVKKPYGKKKPYDSLKSIIHINTDDQSGGAAKIALDLTRWQIKKGFAVRMLVNGKKLNEKFSKAIEPDVSKKQHFLTYASMTLQWQDFFHLSSFALKNDEWIKNAEIIHLHNLHGGYFSYLALPRAQQSKTSGLVSS